MEITADVTYYHQESESVLSRLIRRLLVSTRFSTRGCPDNITSDKFGVIQVLTDSVAYTNDESVINQFADTVKLLSFRRKIIGFFELEEGWDGYNARPPKFMTIARAIVVLDSLSAKKFLPDDVFPSVEGGTSIYFSNGEKYADFEFFNNGETLVGMSDRVNKPIVKEVGIEDIESVIEEIRQFLND